MYVTGITTNNSDEEFQTPGLYVVHTVVQSIPSVLNWHDLFLTKHKKQKRENFVEILDESDY